MKSILLTLIVLFGTYHVLPSNAGLEEPIKDLTKTVGGVANLDLLSVLKNAVPSDLLQKLTEIRPNLITDMVQIITCVTENVKSINICQFNTTLDPIRIAKECADGTDFEKLVNIVEKGMPRLTLPLKIPEYKDQSRCFDPSKLPSDLSTLGIFTFIGKN